jgi:hypothetical protein
MPVLRSARTGARSGGPVALVLTLAGCGGEQTAPAWSTAPALEAVAAISPTGNVLSAVMTARVRFADSVAVRYAVAGSGVENVTPAVVPAGAEVEAPVLGLSPETTYDLRLVAYGNSAVSSGTLQVTTGALPEDLPRFEAGGKDPSPGYVLFASGRYGLAIDNTGRVVWYVHLPDGPSLNFQAQPNGRYIARPMTPDTTDMTPLIELDPLGRVTRRLGCARGLRARFHDVLVQPDGSTWLMCDEVRETDLSALGGVAGAAVMGTVVQHLDRSGGLLFEWSPFDHLDNTDLDPAARSGPSVNWTHGNALDLTPDGNLLVSFRSLNEVTKIDLRTGAVLWRMGGLRNQFTFPDAGPPFLGQHGVRMAEGDLMLLDNLGEPEGSRAERYALDESGRSARLTGRYLPALARSASLGGTTQSLPGRHTLVAFGSGAAVQEYDSVGAVVWEIVGETGYIFRAQRIQSLYHPEIGLAR